MDRIQKTCTMDSEDSLTVRGSAFTKFVFAVQEGDKTCTLAMDSIVDVMRVISSFEGFEGERKFTCHLRESDKMDIESRSDFLIVRVIQEDVVATVFVSLEDGKEIAEFIQAQEGLAVPKADKPDALMAVEGGLRKTCNLSDEDTLRVFNDGEDVAIYTRGGAVVYLKGDDVLDVILELIAYTNTCDTFEGALELTRVKVSVNLERIPIVKVSTPG